jgi:diadenosine tetraphosphatase ApaH/serine/threonine PP2A family protein phosphatase
MAAVRDGALCVAGNHDQRLARALRGGPLKEAVVDMEASLKQLKADPACREAAIPFLDDLLSHYVLDRGRLVVAHAGLAERYHGRASARVRELALFGQPTGERDDDGNPVRADWARDYRGRAAVVYGHFAVAEPRWVNGTVNIDTGCVFGGRLTSLRYPERELVSVPAARVYFARVGAAS